MAAYKNYEEYISRLKGVRTGFDDPKMRTRLNAVLHRHSHLTAWLSAGMAALLFIAFSAYLNFAVLNKKEAASPGSYIFMPFERSSQPVFDYIFSQ